MVLSYLFYMFGAYIVGLQSRSAGVAALAYLFFHPIFYHQVIGIGAMSEEDFNTWYALVFVMHAILGWMTAWALGVQSVFTFHVNEKIPGTCDPCREMQWKAVFYRLGMGILMCCLFTATTLAQELLPLAHPNLYWLGFVLTFLFLAIAHVVFYFTWAFKKPVAINNELKRYFAPYRCGSRDSADRPSDGDMTLDVVIHMMIYYIITWLVFSLVTELAPSWWPFWTALIIFGAGFLILLLARFTWLSISGRRLRRIHGKPGTGQCVKPF